MRRQDDCLDLVDFIRRFICALAAGDMWENELNRDAYVMLGLSEKDDPDPTNEDLAALREIMAIFLASLRGQETSDS